MAKLKKRPLTPAQIAAKETTRKNQITLSMIVSPGEIFVDLTFIRKCRELGLSAVEALAKLEAFEGSGLVARRTVGTIMGWVAVA